MQSTKAVFGTRVSAANRVSARPASRGSVTVMASANRPLWAPGVAAPAYLDGKLAGDRGFDPMGLSSNEAARNWMTHAELVHARWAMLGAAGVLAQNIAHPEIWWYESALPKNMPSLPVGGELNYGGLLAWTFCLMHFVEVRRWMDIKKHGSVNDDPIFSGRSVSNPEPGYPGFDPLGLSKGDFKTLKEKEIKNGRLAMLGFMGFVLSAQSTGLNPIEALQSHLSAPFDNNWTHNIGQCHVPEFSDVQGLKIPLTCLWPGTRV